MKVRFLMMPLCILPSIFLPYRLMAACPSTDMRTPGGSMERIPVSDQKNVGICYAHVASSAYDALLMSGLDQETSTSVIQNSFRSSPLRTSLLYKTEIEKLSSSTLGGDVKKLISYGQTCDAFNLLLKHGSCSQEIIEGKTFLDDFISSEEFIDQFSKVFGKFQVLERGYREKQAVEAQTKKMKLEEQIKKKMGSFHDQESVEKYLGLEKQLQEEKKNKKFTLNFDIEEEMLELRNGELKDFFKEIKPMEKEIEELDKFIRQTPTPTPTPTPISPKNEKKQNFHLSYDLSYDPDDDGLDNSSSDFYLWDEQKDPQSRLIFNGLLCTGTSGSQLANAVGPAMEKLISGVVNILRKSASEFLALKEYGEFICQGKKVIFPQKKYAISCVNKEFSPNGWTFDNLNHRLGLKPSLPVIIHYDSDVLKMGNSYKKPAKFNSIHASLIIGSRENPANHKCEYLIRNSWGPGCSQYSKNWDCENGDIWVDQETLGKSLTELGLIRKQNRGNLLDYLESDQDDF